jgi:hypothetical protein
MRWREQPHVEWENRDMDEAAAAMAEALEVVVRDQACYDVEMEAACTRKGRVGTPGGWLGVAHGEAGVASPRL